MKKMTYIPPDVTTLVNFYLSLGANIREVQQSRQDTAATLGWDVYRVAEIHQMIKENPEWGIHIAVTRGRVPYLTVSFNNPNFYASSQVTAHAADTYYRTAVEDIMRLVRVVFPLKPLSRNQSTPLSVAAIQAAKLYNDYVTWIRNIQSAQNIHDPDQAKLWQELDDILTRL